MIGVSLAPVSVWVREFSNFNKNKRTLDGNESTPMFVRELVRCCNFSLMKGGKMQRKDKHPTPSKKKSFRLDGPRELVIRYRSTDNK